MRTNKILQRTLVFIGTLCTHFALAQQSYSLKEAVSYTIQNHASIRNAQLDILTAASKVQEIKGIGLPQVNGNIGYMNNLVIQKMLVPAKTFNPAAPEDAVNAVEFGVPNNLQYGVGVSQLLFDGTYLLGLKAADVYKELSTKAIVKTKQEAAENVIKTYYSILVNQERINIVKLNIARLDSSITNVKALNKQGFLEKIDVQRLEVTSNNIKMELNNFNRLLDLNYQLLKFHMGKKISDQISIKDKLSDIDIDKIALETAKMSNYEDRIEYSMLKTQMNLAELDLKRNKVAVLPSVALTGNLGFNNGRQKFFDLFAKESFFAASIGIGAKIPIYDGNQRKNKEKQAQFAIDKVKNGFEMLENGIDLQVKQGEITLKNSIESLHEQKSNMALAQEIVRVSKIKYQQGVGTNLELVNAEISYKEAQTNYFTTLYNVLIAKVDLDKALGKLPTE
ncbi:MAG: TolC family protein [Pseudarcicella sp.]|nr:TolC family protein [Pseudarcicella sp.]MBP6410352.1 TolC family protein [Pseudarcicella sp.]